MSPWMSKGGLAAASLCLALAGPAQASDLAANLTAHGGWSALASDRQAAQVGDSLTVLIYESATASNSAKTGSQKTTRAAAQAAAGTGRGQSTTLNLAGAYDGAGQSGRTDTMVAQISVVVVDVLPNGDLRVAGEQALEVNGERTRIKVAGRVRRADLSASNTVLSSRLAEAQIDYNGSGFVAHAARPGLIPRVLGKLGLF